MPAALGEHIATRGLGHAGVPDILRELASFGIAALVHDPLADPADAAGEYGIELGRLDPAAIPPTLAYWSL